MGEGTNYTLLTGATSAIGEAIAVRLSKTRPLLLHGRDSAGLEKIKARCLEGTRHRVWQQDLCDLAAIPGSLEHFLNHSGAKVDTFIHAAGFIVRGPVRLTALPQVQDSLAINFTSAQQILTVLLKKRVNGESLRNILAISSIAARFGVRGHSAYCAAKAALDGWIRALAVELAPRVRANSLLLGPVATPATEKILSEITVAQRISALCPMGVGKPQDGAGAVQCLLSDEMSWMTGQEIIMDGGFTTNATL